MKIKLTKNELKKQRDSLKQFLHYLPTLQLKKQQLQMTILQARKILEIKTNDLQALEEDIHRWVNLLADPGIDLLKWIIPFEIVVDQTNIAGADIPVFHSVVFERAEYDFYLMPLWVDEGIEELRWFVSLFVEMGILKKQIAILSQELRITTQRVNLFEKIKIPECMENIRVIRIYLGDQMANAVGISKAAKNKIAEKEFEEATV